MGVCLALRDRPLPIAAEKWYRVRMWLSLLVLGCASKSPCCENGQVGTCTCPFGAPCAEPANFVDHGDGSCALADTGNETDTDM